MSLNHIIVMGRLGANPELRTTPSGTAVTSFSLAVDRDRKDDNGDRKTDWLDVTAWRQQAEFVCKYATKGRTLVAEGRLQIREWKDKDGNNRRTAEIVAENVYFGDSKPSDGGGSYAPTYNTTTGQQTGFQEINENEGEDTLPF